MKHRKKAVVLISGGLDSMLAARVMQEQGIRVEGINFYTGFCVEGHTRAIRNRGAKQRHNALWVAEQLKIKLHIIDIMEEYKDVVLNPRYGYGAHLNPCLDCKIFMVRKAHEWMLQNGFDFIVSGEVKGQRPMSQRKETLPLIARHSGADDLLLRPLCAKYMPATLPEREGWVDREGLYGFTGRSRRPQIQLAKSFGIQQWAQPAGGCCFLTDKDYSVKLADLWASRGERHYEIDDIMLLKVGRHIRPAENYKLIVAREEGEVKYLQGYRKDYAHLDSESHPGPLALIDGEPGPEQIEQAARILARYGQGREAQQVGISHTDRQGQTRLLQVAPLHPDDLKADWLL
ncbi:tRNA (5-methylaminomethyl-2-thiouridylate)-methyltransferase [Magnetovirga frankeli]|uniref:tRNA (5-methylaminomethyl-2-thiouridylate)-methyltransferase n=1 Tax=Magnetovirga frankeli TaxID=947516 RepID=UPI0012936666|nr:tRNA (5-methylaminomethyl-2-thiouridylate)-methyltransferase [gamma proteobacterium SS-5]